MSHLEYLPGKEAWLESRGTVIGPPEARHGGNGKRVLFPLCFVLWLSAYPSTALGEGTAHPDYPTYDLGEIVVIAPRARPASTVAVVTSQQMEEQGVQTVSEALAMIPGVVVTAGGRKNEVAVHVRGVNPREILVLVDGRSVNMPYYGQVDLNTIPVDDVSRIEVLKGPSSLIYGVNGTGGVVSIVTKGAQGGACDRVSASVGENNTHRVQIATGGQVQRWDYYATASRHRTEGYPLSGDFKPTAYENGGVRDNSDFDRLNLTGKLGCRVSRNRRLVLSGAYYQDNRGIPPSRESPYSRFVDWRRYSVAGSVETGSGGRWALEGQAFYDGFTNELVDYKDARYDPRHISEDSIHDNWSRGAIFQFRLQEGQHALTAAGNTKQQVINLKNTTHPWETFETVGGALALEDAFVAPWLPLTLAAGVSLSGLRSEDAADGHLNSWSLDGTLGADASVGDRFRLRASAGRYTQYPTMHELYSGTRGSVTVNGVMLEPEEAVKVELGGEYTPRPGLAFRSALSRDQYRNLIDDSRGTFRNVWKARVEGVECGLTWQLHRSGTALDVNYTSTDAWDERSGRPLPFIPKHRVDASLSGRARWGGGVYLGAQWVGQRAQEVGSPLDGYFVARSRISYRWKHLSAALIVDNVLDEDYSTEEAEYPMPGRTIQLELAVQTGRAGVLEPGTP